MKGNALDRVSKGASRSCLVLPHPSLVLLRSVALLSSLVLEIIRRASNALAAATSSLIANALIAFLVTHPSVCALNESASSHNMVHKVEEKPRSIVKDEIICPLANCDGSITPLGTVVLWLIVVCVLDRGDKERSVEIRWRFRIKVAMFDILIFFISNDLLSITFGSIFVNDPLEIIKIVQKI